VGTEYKVNDILKLRGGYYFHKSPIPQASFDTTLPDATSNSITVGAGVNLNKNTILDFAYSAMFYEKRKVDNNVGASSSANIDGKYDSFSNIFMLTLTFKL
jgi:long-chain fatty acid transport protein